MTIECWTIIHHVAAKAATTATHAARIVRHIGTQGVRHAAPRISVSHPHTWVEIVCRTLPAAVAGGTLLVPQPASPPPPPAPVPITVPAPPAVGLGGGWVVPPIIVQNPAPAFVPPPQARVVPAGPAVEPIPEPATLPLLLAGLACLISATTARSWHRRHQPPHPPQV